MQEEKKSVLFRSVVAMSRIGISTIVFSLKLLSPERIIASLLFELAQIGSHKTTAFISLVQALPSNLFPN